MAATMNGKTLAAEIREQLAAEVKRLPVPPGLRVILVGSKSDAKAYLLRRISELTRTTWREHQCAGCRAVVTAND